MITDGNDASPMDDYKGWTPKPTTDVDIVAHPPHYARWKMEPIEFIAINNLPWWLANVIKYTMRFDAKDGIKDLYKARSYLDMKIREVEGHKQFWDKPVTEERSLNSGHAPLPPEAHYVTTFEGGMWEPFVPGTFDKVHAIQFTDDKIWDAHHGWRTNCSTGLQRNHEEPRVTFHTQDAAGNPVVKRPSPR